MFRGFVRHVKTKDVMPQVQRQLDKLARVDVWVGIPQAENAPRGENLNNSQLLFILEHGVRKASMAHEMRDAMNHDGLSYRAAYDLYIHEHGSPLWRIPPRPVLEPALASVQGTLANLYRRAIDAALQGQDPMPYLEVVRSKAQWAAQEWFTDPRNNWAPNAPSTIKRKGSARPMIDTGEMRRAIVGVIRKRGTS